MSDEEYEALIELSKRLGFRPTTLALQAVANFIKKNFGETDLLQYLPVPKQDQVGIYFQLSKRSALKLDRLCWKKKKSRNAMAKKIIDNALKEFDEK